MVKAIIAATTPIIDETIAPADAANSIEVKDRTAPPNQIVFDKNLLLVRKSDDTHRIKVIALK
jgi:hypothetical protein